MTDYSEFSLVEQPAIALFRELGWETKNCFYESLGENGTLGRETSSEVVLVPRLRAALERLNPGAPREAIDFAVEELTRDRSLMSPARANREVYLLLKDGVKALTPTLSQGERESDGEGFSQTQRESEDWVTLRVIDWNEAGNNDFFLASQFWVTGEMYKRRADLVGFINGLPLVFIELKKLKIEHAYEHNLKDYKQTVPQLFWHNAFIILSNGTDSRIGSMTATWEHFAEWKKLNESLTPGPSPSGRGELHSVKPPSPPGRGVGGEGMVSLETMIRGTCEPSRLLDIVENFVLFSEERGGLVKMVAKNHQYLGVNNAIEALQRALIPGPSPSGRGGNRLGVFWHTQGSGKSYSMVFFSQKILRKVPGNWTFVTITDRDELDGQIYRNFAKTGAVTEPEKRLRAQSGEHLKTLLTEDHRYVFTLIQKFHTERGAKYPMLSDRADVIVMTDEAHRSQYDVFALNMRNALPHAAFIGFTGTPLMAGEEKTREVFGDYVSVYNFRQSADDRNTVPLFYENRIPELQLTNENLNDDMAALLEAAELDEDQEKKVEREFAREYHLITRDDRLEEIAKDLVTHFVGRGFPGKAMVVSIDKATAVKMYDKVQTHWKQHLNELQTGIETCVGEERAEIERRVEFMQTTDMAVVVSSSQNEVDAMKKKGADIVPHRQRMVTEDLETKFKDPDDPFRLVFVCAMWMTGFDVPSCSTIYLDKPMKNHTLMQTIARANRVFKEKHNGLIVDYVGVFRELQKALAIYGTSAGGIAEGDTPVRQKDELIAQLKLNLDEAISFCAERGVDVSSIQQASGFPRLKLIDDAVEAMLADVETKGKFLSLADDVDKLFKAILPDPLVNEFGPPRSVIVVIADKIRANAPEVDISTVMEAVEDLLDQSIAAQGYVIEGPRDRIVDLSLIDFDALKKHFDRSRKRTEAEKLKAAVARKLHQMVRLNRTRIDFLDKLRALIEEYNSGSMNVDVFFEKLMTFAQQLTAEERRGIGEQLSEEELAIFDLLTKHDSSYRVGKCNESRRSRANSWRRSSARSSSSTGASVSSRAPQCGCALSRNSINSPGSTRRTCITTSARWCISMCTTRTTVKTGACTGRRSLR